MKLFDILFDNIIIKKELFTTFIEIYRIIWSLFNLMMKILIFLQFLWNFMKLFDLFQWFIKKLKIFTIFIEFIEVFLQSFPFFSNLLSFSCKFTAVCKLSYKFPIGLFFVNFPEINKFGKIPLPFPHPPSPPPTIHH